MLDLVEDLIQQVRDVTDEDNVNDISDEFIIRALNRAQQDLVSEITRKYNPQFMQEVILTQADFKTDLQGKARVATLPTRSFAYRVNSVDAKIGDTWTPVRQVPFSHTLALDIESGTSLPVVYSMQGNKIYVYPNIDQLAQLRIRYQVRPPKLVATQGRVTEIGENYVIVDDIGTGLSSSVDDLTAFINFVDSGTGLIKGTAQVVGLNEASNRITIQVSSPNLSRTSVFGFTVSAAVPTDLSLDDYVCLASGTCIPYLASDLSNYHVELAAFHVKRALGTVGQADFSERDRVIERITKLWSGRENTMKINKTRNYPLYSWQSWFRGS